MPANQICEHCGAAAHQGDRYCFSCGASMPVPARGPTLLIGAVAVVASLVVLVLLFRPSGGEEATAAATTLGGESPTSLPSSTTTTTTTSAVAPRLGPIAAADVSCSSELPTHPCQALIDGDRSTAWNAPGSGLDAEIRVTFSQPVRLATITFENAMDDESLMRNARLREIEIHLGPSTPPVLAELESGHGPFRVSVPPDPTTSLVVHINSVYEGQHVGDLEPFDELALFEVSLSGFGD